MGLCRRALDLNRRRPLRWYQHATTAEANRSFNIAPAVADIKGLREIDTKVGRSAFEQQRIGLSAPTSFVRWMRAIVSRIDARAMLGEELVG
ncbi:MAG: hypothetical protein ABI875_05595, partial [Gemmatimonadales bacterium]